MTLHQTNLATELWSVSQQDLWLWEHFEEAVFLFNPLSNETHVLNALTVEILQFLATRPASLADILQHFRVETAPTTDDLAVIYPQLLKELDRLGLITPKLL